MTSHERQARLLDKLLGLAALTVVCCGLIFLSSCACAPDKPYCAEPFPNAAPRQ